MNKDIKSFDDWIDEFHQINQSVDETLSFVKNLEKWIWDNVVAKDVFPYPQMPSEVSEALDALDQGLRTIKHTTDNLRWYFCRNPLNKYLTGQRLTKEEFYLLAAQGIMIIPSKSGLKEAHEEISYYLYEDNEKRGYINPSNPPAFSSIPAENGQRADKVNAGLTVGIAPESVRISFLRPDQKEFFRKFKPDLFSRFKKD